MGLLIVDVQHSDLSGTSGTQGGPKEVQEVKDVEFIQQATVSFVEDPCDVLIGFCEGSITRANPAVTLQALTCGSDVREVDLEALTVRWDGHEFADGLSPAFSAVAYTEDVVALGDLEELGLVFATTGDPLGALEGYVYRRVKSPKHTHLRFETHAAALEQ
jgi:hypothetical protein